MAPNTMLWGQSLNARIYLNIKEIRHMIVFHNLLVIDVVFLRNCKACINLKKKHKVCVGIVGFKVLSICYLVSIHVTMGNFSDDTSYE